MSDFEFELVIIFVALIALVQERRLTRMQKDIDRIRDTTNKTWWRMMQE